MKNTITQYRADPRLSGCDAAFVLVIADNAQNEDFRNEHKTGYWGVRDDDEIIGKALFLVSKEIGGARKLHVGVIEKIIPDEGKKVIQVKEFFPLPDVTSTFRKFFGLTGTNPNSPTRLDEGIWPQGVVGSGEETISPPAEEEVSLGLMVERLSWHRLNHHVFRNSVWKMWEGRCAVTGAHCNGLLVASHILPWTLSTEQERTEKHNGLLLSAGLDALFDRGLIGFSSEGNLLISTEVTNDTREVFGLRSNARLRVDCFPSQMIPGKMEQFLAEHRRMYGLDTPRT